MEVFLTLSIVVLALISFIVEWLPVDLTAIAVTVLLMFLGLVTPEQGISGFGNSATITVMAMFILSAGITRTGVIQIIRDRLIKWGGKRINQQLFVMGSLVGPISAFINNTAVIAIFLPIIEDWCKQQKTSPSQFLIPLSYASILGGMITVIGTSTNILAGGISEQLGYGNFHIFQFTSVGLLTFLIGLLYISLIAPKLLPKRESRINSAMENSYDLQEYLSEVVVTNTSSLVGQTLRESEIQRKFDLDVLELVRNKIHLPQPVADKVLKSGDILIIRSTREDLLKIKNERGLDLLPDVKFREQSLETVLSSGEEKIAEVLILSNSRLIGTTLKDLRFRQRYNVTVLAIRRGAELVQGRLGKIKLRFGDLLLVQGPKESFIGLQTTRELLVLEQRDIDNLRTEKAGIAIGITLGVIALAAFKIVPILVSALAGVILMVATGCLKPGEMYGAVRWDVIFLLAGLIPLGIAMENSGATEWLANNLVSVGGHLSGYWVLTFFFIITVLLTEVLSNNATVVLMIPIAVRVAETLQLNPYAFMFAVTLAASCSFMTPIGYQTNTMVYSPGGYKFSDFTRVGFLLTLLMTIAVPSLITLFYGLYPN
ncbi:SLC13 family permease [Arthrospira platensis]|uniref:Na+/sulfate symporter n=1 Tax=Limnospira platensis NIES-46 TaxID=1236695 RepID=A0A5M3T9M0_LIMPL|nr:SLC13 family permease [Arthrospira platensis]AMW28184.1 transporter [Arthrospira platensis YZ]KDR56799.1 transporter [Arthrospira platensis str. Paraca]MBD2668380.1 SLC13 family permease [Arthrospira platensis FACHB-439]MBD2710046.1 SLC13 family permease [Arthrospira platensis FACHB-835]MDF2209319.1 SLC13 family permease [Arthrospira platensis NCB002]MDT9181984.1 SLC13 family permease [Limnospira sp. PMC 289.06]MDT9294137.1 SLC13 family permease [Arthrospira platensis PCC 7345]MDT9309631